MVGGSAVMSTGRQSDRSTPDLPALDKEIPDFLLSFALITQPLQIPITILESDQCGI